MRQEHEQLLPSPHGKTVSSPTAVNSEDFSHVRREHENADSSVFAGSAFERSAGLDLGSGFVGGGSSQATIDVQHHMQSATATATVTASSSAHLVTREAESMFYDLPKSGVSHRVLGRGQREHNFDRAEQTMHGRLRGESSMHDGSLGARAEKTHHGGMCRGEKSMHGGGSSLHRSEKTSHSGTHSEFSGDRSAHTGKYFGNKSVHGAALHGDQSVHSRTVPGLHSMHGGTKVTTDTSKHGSNSSGSRTHTRSSQHTRRSQQGTARIAPSTPPAHSASTPRAQLSAVGDSSVFPHADSSTTLPPPPLHHSNCPSISQHTAASGSPARKSHTSSPRKSTSVSPNVRQRTFTTPPLPDDEDTDTASPDASLPRHSRKKSPASITFAHGHSSSPPSPTGRHSPSDPNRIFTSANILDQIHADSRQTRERLKDLKATTIITTPTTRRHAATASIVEDDLSSSKKTKKEERDATSTLHATARALGKKVSESGSISGHIMDTSATGSPAAASTRKHNTAGSLLRRDIDKRVGVGDSRTPGKGPGKGGSDQMRNWESARAKGDLFAAARCSSTGSKDTWEVQVEWEDTGELDIQRKVCSEFFLDLSWVLPCLSLSALSDTEDFG